MPEVLILASASPTRLKLLKAANVPVMQIEARVDEAEIKASLRSEGVAVRDIADALAEAKARKIAVTRPESTVVGADQTLGFEGELLSKPETPDEAIEQLTRLSAQRHQLHSAAVIYDEGRPVWRYVSTVHLTMRPLSADYIEDYVERNWESIRYSVGGYKIEEEGCRLFSRIDGSHFAILGLPLIEILSYLSLRGDIDT